MPQLAGRAFNIGGGPENAVSLREVLLQIAAFDGGALEITNREWRVGDQRYYVSDTSAFNEATGWTPTVGVADGIHRLYQWLSQVVDRVTPRETRSRGRDRRRSQRAGTDRRRVARQTSGVFA
jgi:CDP-paratose 2-epimerase